MTERRRLIALSLLILGVLLGAPSGFASQKTAPQTEAVPKTTAPKGTSPKAAPKTVPQTPPKTTSKIEPKTAAKKESNKPRWRVLFIGNSYTYFNNLPELLTGLTVAKTAKPVEARMIVRGGATLQFHWEQGEALRAIQQGKWDYVVLQEQSTLPITDPATMHKFARLFDAEIKKVKAKTLFFLTWARQNQPENQAKLNDAYTKIAKELGARVAPVGPAWARAFQEEAKIILHTDDQSHPTPLGSYMAACVFYAVLYNKSPEGLGHKVVVRESSVDGTINEQKTETIDINAKEAAHLQRLAWQTIKDRSWQTARTEKSAAKVPGR